MKVCIVIIIVLNAHTYIISIHIGDEKRGGFLSIRHIDYSNEFSCANFMVAVGNLSIISSIHMYVGMEI